MSLPTYQTGTVSVAASGTVVTLTGGFWSGTNVKQGDFISIGGSSDVLITEVTDDTHLKIAPWPGAAQSGAAYVIYQNYVGRVVGVAAAEDVGIMLEKLHTDGLPFILGAAETVPDPSYGDEGQLAFKPSTGEWWVKQGGVWVHSAGLTALGYGGTSATSVLIGMSPPPKVFTTQPNLAYNGARVRAASAANLNNWMEGVATYSGTTLTMTCDGFGGSGAHADWLFSIAGQKGATGSQGPQGIQGGTFPDAPNDGSIYGRKNATWTATAGGTPPSNTNPSMDGAAAPGTATPYSREDHVHPSDTSKAGLTQVVRYDAPQTLTDDVGTTVGQKTQARKNVYAAPFDAMAYNGLQINGSIEISQELGTGGTLSMVNGTVKYFIDGFGAALIGTGATAVAGQITGLTSLPGFTNCIYFGCSAINSLAGTTDGQWLYEFIEGYRWSRLAWGTVNAQPITIGFWINPPVSGTMAVSVRAADNNRCYVVDVPIVVGSWQYKTVTIPGDVAGTSSWGVANNVAAAIVGFCFGAGSGRKAATANTWSAGGAIATPATTNFFAATGTTYLTGVVVLPGIEAPSAARSPFIMRPYDQELVTCKRYFWKRGFLSAENIGMLQAYGPAVAGGPLFILPNSMRIPPTVTPSSLAHFQAYTSGGGGPLLPVTLNFASTVDAVSLNTSTFNTGFVAGNAAAFSAVNTSAWLQMDARLV